MEFSKSFSKKNRGQGSRKKPVSKCWIVTFVVLVTTWFCHSPGYVNQQESSLQPSQDARQVDVCYGKRVYMYDMPEIFNVKLLELCDGGLVPWIRFCDHFQNYGFGEIVNVTGDMFRNDWYRTDAYMLEVIFFERMRLYPCLTDSPATADIFFVPYFSGIDALPYLYNETRFKDVQGHEVISWLHDNGAEWWRRYSGRDHFMIAGRTGWDFHIPAETEWGTAMFELNEMRNVTFMVLERRPWGNQEQAIPYPVGFHPSTAASLNLWIERVRKSVRTALFSFSGSLRPQMAGSIRGILSNQCINASTECSRLDCSVISCSHNPEPIYDSLLQADFCLQPRGDTATRRSTFDSIVSGCIPVLFHEYSAKIQYMWHLPEDHRTFSVFIPENCVMNGECNVWDILKKIKPAEVLRMREKLITMIPSMLYRHPSSVDYSWPDAFDLTIEGMSRKVASFKKPSENLVG